MFLAAAVPARAGQRVLDIGAGAGVAGLCLLVRVPGLELTAVEIDAEMTALAARNAERNGFAGHFQAIKADVTSTGKALRKAGLVSEHYHHVIANPPFYAESKVRAAPDRTRAEAHVMRPGGLAAWVRFSASMAAPNGLLTLIHRPDGLGELLALLHRRFGDVTILPRFPKARTAAARIIVQARKGSRAGMSLLPGIALHGPDGHYTAEAEAVLREAAALDLSKSDGGRNRRE